MQPTRALHWICSFKILWWESHHPGRHFDHEAFEDNAGQYLCLKWHFLKIDIKQLILEYARQDITFDFQPATVQPV